MPFYFLSERRRTLKSIYIAFLSLNMMLPVLWICGKMTVTKESERASCCGAVLMEYIHNKRNWIEWNEAVGWDRVERDMIYKGQIYVEAWRAAALLHIWESLYTVYISPALADVCGALYRGFVHHHAFPQNCMTIDGERRRRRRLCTRRFSVLSYCHQPIFCIYIEGTCDCSSSRSHSCILCIFHIYIYRTVLPRLYIVFW